QAFAVALAEDGLEGLRPGRFGLEGRQSAPGKIVDGVAYSLVVAAKVAGNRGGMHSVGTREQHLAAPDGKARRPAQPGLEGNPVGGTEGSDIEWCLHGG